MEWESIPTVVLLKIYGLLPGPDRLSASATCRNWRCPVFQVPLIKHLNLSLKNDTDPERIHFLIDMFFWKLESLKLEVDPSVEYCLELAQQVLTSLEDSPKLHTLKIRFSDNSLVRNCFHPRNIDQDSVVHRILIYRNLISPLLAVMNTKNCLETFSFPLVNKLASYSDRLYTSLAENTRHWYTISNLFLATLRITFPDNAVQENTLQLDQLLDPNFGIRRFAFLQMLSIDHDVLTDEVLATIGMNNVVGGLKKMTIVAIKPNMFVTNAGWSYFVAQNPECKIRLTLIGSEVTMDQGSNLIMRAMPITHFRALYCRGLRMACLNSLIRWNENTLEHLELVNENVIWMNSILEGVPEEEETEFLDPVIFAAWRCQHLRVIKISYRYFGESLIGIARLRGPKLFELDIPKSQIVYNSMTQLSQEISKALGRPWKASENSFKRTPTLQKILKKSMQCIEADEADRQHLARPSA
ncbi:unnamed protein product [Allacma fusca]|uniref:F-box domain-containing protein n=1 Tax=Allacma fusca TaxID=39272 RepID=A0A8J2K1I5_9HEXA|nr:unnamed protein product [Allacma fusca]